jgi:hypothetical protein
MMAMTRLSGPGHPFRGQRRGGGGAQRGGDGEFGQQQRVAGVHVGQHAEGGDRQQAQLGVLGVAVDVFEGVLVAVAGRHQLDHAVGRMDGVARRLVEIVPAPVVMLDLAGQAFDEGGGAALAHDFLDAFNANVVNHDGAPGLVLISIVRSLSAK